MGSVASRLSALSSGGLLPKENRPPVLYTIPVNWARLYQTTAIVNRKIGAWTRNPTPILVQVYGAIYAEACQIFRLQVFKIVKMKNQQQSGKIEGAQVFIFGKEIKNDGKIISSGDNAKTHLETERYSGSGIVESHSKTKIKKGPVESGLVQIVIGVIATISSGLVLYYFFGIK